MPSRASRVRSPQASSPSSAASSGRRPGSGRPGTRPAATRSGSRGAGPGGGADPTAQVSEAFGPDRRLSVNFRRRGLFLMHLARAWDLRFEALLRTGRLGKWYSSVGNEAVTVAAGLSLCPGDALL